MDLLALEAAVFERIALGLPPYPETPPIVTTTSIYMSKQPLFIHLVDRAGAEWIFHTGKPTGMIAVEEGRPVRFTALVENGKPEEAEKLLARAADWLRFRQAPDFRQWLQERPCISINCLEKTIGAPQGTLAKYVSGERGLNEQWVASLKEILRDLGLDN